MGHYTGIHICFTLKPTAKPELITFLKEIFNEDEEFSKDAELTNPNLSLSTYSTLDIPTEEREFKFLSETLSNHVKCSNPEFEQWRAWRWEDSDGFITFESLASLKFDHLEILCMFFDSFKEHLAISDGDILVRSIYEGSFVENCVCYHQETKTFIITKGYDHRTGVKFRDYYPDVLDCPTHPYNFEEGDDPFDDFLPPMNIYEIYPEKKGLSILTNKNEFMDEIPGHGFLDGHHTQFYPNKSE